MAIPVPVVFSMPVCVGLFFFFRVLILRKGILQKIQSESSGKVEAPGKGLRGLSGGHSGSRASGGEQSGAPVGHRELWFSAPVALGGRRVGGREEQSK